MYVYVCVCVYVWIGQIVREWLDEGAPAVASGSSADPSHAHTTNIVVCLLLLTHYICA